MFGTEGISSHPGEIRAALGSQVKTAAGTSIGSSSQDAAKGSGLMGWAAEERRGVLTTEKSLWNGERMKLLSKLALCCGIAWGMSGAAQETVAQGPPLVTATGPEMQMHAGFEYIGQQVPSVTSREPMYGVDSGLTVGITRRLGIRLDLGYARTQNLLSSGHPSDILSYMGGPVFYPIRTPRASPYVELLVGGARVTGATPDGNGGYIRGYANELAWAGGGGLEIHTSREFALRVGADYMHTSYWDANYALAGQGNLRAVVSFAYYWGARRR